mgnify:CR=1 FL=1
MAEIISIHLMLRFITQKLQIAAADNKISIHPMLRFITVPRMMQHESPNFNTSHVTVYPIALCGSAGFFRISIHPMLRFIIQNRNKQTLPDIFQYIPCYGLSGLTFLRMVMLINFNTSHVTVYQHSSYEKATCKVISIHPMLRFIYRLNVNESVETDFNTSHVTVYPAALIGKTGFDSISIHPMLRFIVITIFRKTTPARISIHPMLRFIQYLCTRKRIRTQISIHPMLRFIASLIVKIPSSTDFNTSHVTVYPT